MLTYLPPLSRLPALEPPNTGFAATDGGEDDVWANRDGGGAPAESGLGFLGTFLFISVRTGNYTDDVVFFFKKASTINARKLQTRRRGKYRPKLRVPPRVLGCLIRGRL